MPEPPSRYSWKKRLLLGVAGLFSFLLLFIVSIRVTVSEMFRGIASSRASGLSAMVPWDTSSMWSRGGPMLQKGSGSESWIARNADLRMRCSSFENSVAALRRIVSAHRGYLEDLRTESRFGFGRSLSAMLSVPSDEFDAALADLQTLGRVEAVDQEGEDAAVKLATAARRLAAAQTNSLASRICSTIARVNYETPWLSRRISLKLTRHWQRPGVCARACSTLWLRLTSEFPLWKIIAPPSKSVLQAHFFLFVTRLPKGLGPFSRLFPLFSAFFSATACRSVSGSLCCFCLSGPSGAASATPPRLLPQRDLCIWRVEHAFC